jgi:hypothetical protein
MSTVTPGEAREGRLAMAVAAPSRPPVPMSCQTKADTWSRNTLSSLLHCVRMRWAKAVIIRVPILSMPVHQTNHPNGLWTMFLDTRGLGTQYGFMHRSTA